jgi:hypothetical protein
VPECAPATEAQQQKSIEEDQYGPRALLGEAHMVLDPEYECEGAHGNGTASDAAGSLFKTE